MEAKCFRRGCDFADDVPHMDAAVECLREHYRATHPTKSFNEVDNRSWLETWNCTVDEWLTQVCVGPGGETDYSYLNEYLRGYMGPDRMPEAIRNDLQQVYDNWVAERNAQRPAPMFDDVAVDVNAVAPAPARFVPFPPNRARARRA